MSIDAVISKPKRWYVGLTGYHYLVLAVAACGWLFDTMDQWIYVLARNPALTDLLSTPGHPASLADVSSYSGWVQGIFIFGWATGGLFFGMVGDRLGRTTTMAITVLIYAVFTGLSGLAQHWQTFAAFRFMTGLGIGGEFAAGASLVAEVFPEHARATALGIMQACSALGNIAAGAIGLTVTWFHPNPGGWRVMFFVGLAPAVMVFVIRMLVKEPERWEHEKQRAAMGQIQLGAIWNLWTDPVLRRNMLVGVGLAAVGVIGFWGIGTFTPDLLKGVLNPQGKELAQHTSMMMSVAVMVQNSGSFFGMLGWAIFAHHFGRRRAFTVSLLLCAVIVPFTFHMTHSMSGAMILFPIMGFATSSLFGGYAVYFPELFPTRLRATGTGVCYNVARYFAIIGPTAFGTLSARYGIAMAATLVSIVFLLGLLVIPFAPETRGKPLPE